MEDKITSVFHESGHFRIEDKNKIRLDENTERFVRELTGMTTPKVLERIAEYFRGVTPIQHRIEMAVTNGRGYLEKGQTTYGSSLLRLQMPGYQRHPNPEELFVVAEQLGANPDNFKLEDWLSGYVVVKNGHLVFEPARGVRR